MENGNFLILGISNHLRQPEIAADFRLVTDIAF